MQQQALQRAVTPKRYLDRRELYSGDVRRRQRSETSQKRLCKS